MYRKILSDIERKSFEPLYLLFGEEQFLINDLSKKMISTFGKECVHYCDSLSAALENVMCSSINGRDQLFVVPDADIKSINKKILELLSFTIQHSVAHNTIILIYKSTLPATSSILKIPISRIFNAKKLTNVQYDKFIREYMNSNITTEAITMLRSLVNDDLSSLVNEMDKLMLYSPNDVVDVEIIKQNLSYCKTYNAFELLKVIINKDLNIISNILNQVKNTTDAILIVSLLYYVFSKTLLYNDDNNSSYISYFQRLQCKQILSNYDISKIEDVMKYLLEADLHLKSVDTSIPVDCKSILVTLIANIIS